MKIGYVEFGICVMREFFQTDFQQLVSDEPTIFKEVKFRSTVFTKGSCAACLVYQEILGRTGKDMLKKYVVDRDVTVEEIRKRFSKQAVTVPIVVIDEQYIGGYY